MLWVVEQEFYIRTKLNFLQLKIWHCGSVTRTDWSWTTIIRYVQRFLYLDIIICAIRYELRNANEKISFTSVYIVQNLAKDNSFGKGQITSANIQISLLGIDHWASWLCYPSNYTNMKIERHNSQLMKLFSKILTECERSHYLIKSNLMTLSLWNKSACT